MPHSIGRAERFRQLERRQTWLWLLASTLLVSLGAGVVILWTIGQSGGFAFELPAPETRTTVAVGLPGLVVLFCLYMFHQQIQLRRMAAQVLEAQLAEEAMRARLGGVASLFSAVAEVGLEMDLAVALQTLCEHIMVALHADRAEIHLEGAPGAAGAPPHANVVRDELLLGIALVVGPETIGRLEIARHASSGTPFTDEDRRVVEAFASSIALTLRNIRERGRDEHVRHAVRLEAVGRMAGGVAHDFNNLLTAIRGYGELMLRGLPPGAPLRRNAEEIVRATQRASGLTRQLLSFSRHQSNRPMAINLNEVVTDLQGLMRQLVGEHVTLVLKCAPGLWNSRADRGRIEQVILNLTLNARDAMCDGGCLEIETANADSEDGDLGGENRYVVLRVTDTGVGMDDATQVGLFEPYFTTTQPGHGTGIGLSTVYAIVRQCGGDIRVKSAPGRGTTFSVLLPRFEAGVTHGHAIGATAPEHRGWETILVVEDEEAMRTLTRDVLTSHGYTVLEACRGSEALRLSESHRGPIHLLLTDMVLPGMSGGEVVTHLKPRRPEMQVLYMSGHTVERLHRLGEPIAADMFLQKPFSPDDLAERVRRSLDAAAHGARTPMAA
jgi:signal transduction histidine kinase/CheY-like chemotaxis protein